MQPPFLLTQSRNLHNDSMWKKNQNWKYKIVVVRTYILIFLTHWPPEELVHLILQSFQATPKNHNLVLHFARPNTSNWCFWQNYDMKFQQPLNEQQHSFEWVAYDI